MAIIEGARIENNLIKHIICICTKSKSTGLMSALGIDLVIDNIKKQKLNSFNRLINNEYTKEFIQWRICRGFRGSGCNEAPIIFS